MARDRPENFPVPGCATFSAASFFLIFKNL
jgi:hypothetical protein